MLAKHFAWRIHGLGGSLHEDIESHEPTLEVIVHHAGVEEVGHPDATDGG